MNISNGLFEGYAYLFGVEVRGETIAPGAFREFIATYDGLNKPIPILWNHNPDLPIGIVLSLEEDDTGLLMKGRILQDVEKGAEVISLIEANAADGLSISFDALTANKQGDLNVITSVKLWEISVCTFPAVEGAGIGDGKMELYDRMQIADGSVRRTKDGYLVAEARVARTGIQMYKGYELGRPDLADVRVYRSPEEVFSAKAIRSFAHRPITYHHPPVEVTADNWKEYSVGAIGEDVMKDGEFIRVPLVLMDAATIHKVEKEGVRELSMGYSTELKWGRGITKDGLEYDAMQTDIEANHLAVVPAARGGSNLRIGDIVKTKEIEVMTTAALKAITVDGVTVQMEDTAAQVVSRALARAKELSDMADARIKDLEKKVTDADAKAGADKVALDTATGKIATLEQSVKDAAITPEKLDKLVIDRVTVMTQARKIAGDKFVVDGKTDLAIRREVVSAKLGDAVAKAMNDDAINGAFGALVAQTGDGKGGGAQELADALRHRPGGGAQPVQDEKTRDEAWTSMVNDLGERWRGQKAA